MENTTSGVPILQDWSNVLYTAFADMWSGIIQTVPKIVVSIVIFVAGWVVGAFLGRIVAQFLRSIKIDTALESIGVGDIMNRAGYKLDGGYFVGQLVKWFIIIVFLLAALQVLGLTQVSVFLSAVLMYIPRLIIAALILAVAAIVADFLQRVVVGSARAAEVDSAELFGAVVRWAVWVFALFAALEQLGVQSSQTVLTGIVAMLALAGGLAFGLGGRDAAGDFIAKLRREMGGKK